MILISVRSALINPRRFFACSVAALVAASAERAENADLKHLFSRFSSQRATFKDALGKTLPSDLRNEHRAEGDAHPMT